MAARLIINADDFGLTRGINRAVGELYTAGALTSATLMANGPAFEDAVAVARAHPGLGVGCHVVFIDGVPLCRPETVPSLMGAKGLRSSLAAFAGTVIRRAVKEEDLIREGVAQVRRLQGAGIVVSHLDTHKHTHMLPLVARALLRVACECGVGAIRNPFEPRWSRAVGRSGFARRLSVMLLDATLRRGFECQVEATPLVSTPGGTLGIAATGSLDKATLQSVLEKLPNSGTWELVVHPGYNDAELGEIRTRLRQSREVERRTLLECVPERPLPSNLELIQYGDIYGLWVDSRRQARHRSSER